MDFEIFRVGNIIKYQGPLNEHAGFACEILGIETWNEEPSYEILVLNPKLDPNQVIRAYSEDIREIYLTPAFLLKNGFHFDGDKLYSNALVSLLKIDFLVAAINIFGEQEGLALEDKGFGVLLGKIEDFTTKEGILSKVQLLNSVHSLQNYYESALQKHADFTV